MDTIRTLVCTEPGFFDYRTSPMPESFPDQAIIKVRRIGVCGTDLHAFEGVQPYFSYPRILGHEISGDLVDVQPASGFAPGETVTIIPYFSCGNCIACRNGKPNACASLNVFGVHSDGGMREYISVPATSLVHGNGLDADSLALVEPLSIGAHGVRRAGVENGTTVLVVGAGPIGLACIEMAQLAGAKVIALDVNVERLAFCRNTLGLEHVIDARSHEVQEQIAAITSGEMVEVVIDATGNLVAINNAFRYLSHGGRYILVGLQKGDIHFSHPEFHKREAMLASSRNATRADFDRVIQYIKEKAIRPENYITHRALFPEVKHRFPGWLDPKNGVIKAMITVAE